MGIDVNGSVLRDMWEIQYCLTTIDTSEWFFLSRIEIPFICNRQIQNAIYSGGDPRISPYKSNKFYEYDPTTDTWTALPDFPGPAREAAKPLNSTLEIYLFFGGDTSMQIQSGRQAGRD